MKSLQSVFEKIEFAVNAIKNGDLVIAADNEERENEGDLLGAAEFMTSDKMNFIISKAKGLVCAPMSEEYIRRFDLHPMATKNTDNYGTKFTVSIDSTSVHTGISAIERAKTLNDLCSPDKTKDHFRRPGHIFPLLAEKDGVLYRNGHTEASVDLLKLAGLKEVAVICEIIAENGDMLRGEGLERFAQENRLKMFSISDLIVYRLFKELPFSLQYEVALSQGESLRFYQSSAGYRLGVYLKGKEGKMKFKAAVVKDLSAFRGEESCLVVLEMKNSPRIPLCDARLRPYVAASLLYKLSKELKFIPESLDNQNDSREIVNIVQEAKLLLG